MQDIFGNDNEIKELLKSSLSPPRLSKYLLQANGDLNGALELYRWNALLSQSLYTYVQAWEICLRNKISGFLAWKYRKPNWPYDDQAKRNFKGNDRRKLEETIQKQEQDRNEHPTSTPSIIADLTAGFWVSQLTYSSQYAWKYNLGRVFPRNQQITAEIAHAACDEILNLRNRIAHHEAIYHLDLPARRNDMSMIVNSMCLATHAYAEATCTFARVWAARPK